MCYVFGGGSSQPNLSQIFWFIPRLIAITYLAWFSQPVMSAQNSHLVSASNCKAMSSEDSIMLQWRETGLTNTDGDGTAVVCPIYWESERNSSAVSPDVLNITSSFVNGIADGPARQIACSLYGYSGALEISLEEILIPLNSGMDEVTHHTWRVRVPSALKAGTFALRCSLPSRATISKITISAYEGWFLTGQPASILLGGIGFNQTGGSLLFNHPKGIATDGKRIFLCDGNNNRVLIWNEFPKANTPPDIVLGQPDFHQLEPGTGLDNLNWPVSVSTDGTRLLVADTYNHRILVWDSIPTQNGQPADWSIDGFSNDAEFPLSPGKDQFVWPWGVWTDGDRLVVSSTSESTSGGVSARGGWVLIWNSFPESAQQKADIVLSEEGKMGTPRTITSDGKKLMVGDHNASGETSKMGSWVWNVFPTADEQAADFFLTEEPPTIWLQGAISQNNQLVALGSTLYVWNTFPSSGEDLPDLSLNSNRLGLRSGDGSDAIIVGDDLILSDYNGNRLLGFDGIPEDPETFPSYVVGSDSISVNTLDTNYFITNPEPASDGKQFFVASAFDQVLHGWNTLPTVTAQKPDFSYETTDGAVAVILHNEHLVLPGRQGSLNIWNGLPTSSREPDLSLTQEFGGASFFGLLGGCSDGSRVYLLDDKGGLTAWDGLPTDFTSPAFQVDFGAPFPSRVSCSKDYLAITVGGKISLCPSQKLPDVASCVSVTTALFSKSLASTLFVNDSFFIADRGNNQIHGWRNISDAIDGNDPDLLLGASNYSDITPETDSDSLFWPATLAFDGSRLWVGEYKFSGRLLGYEMLF